MQTGAEFIHSSDTPDAEYTKREGIQNSHERIQPDDKPVAGHIHRREALKRSKLIVFIMNALHSSAAGLFEHLQKLLLEELLELKRDLPHHTRKSPEHRKTVEHILDHPYLLEYNLPAIFATFPFADAAVRQSLSDVNSAGLPAPEAGQIFTDSSVAQSLFIAVLKNLAPKDKVNLEDIFQKKTADSKSEKSLLRKILLQAPEKAVLFMKFMTGLPAAELDRLQPQSSLHEFAGTIFREQMPSASNEDDDAKKFYISNAGLCLIAPYLSGLFNNLGFIEKSAFKNKAALTRAIALLQYIATGMPASPEYTLQLNKLLCGLLPRQTVTLRVRLTKKEKAEADSLLEAVIANWPALKSTSVQGFREAFLQRKGILFRNETAWSLQVEKKGHDMLLNTIPWGFNMIRLPWMKKMIQVEW